MIVITQVQKILDDLTRKLGIVKVQDDSGNELPTGDDAARAIHVQTDGMGSVAGAVDANNSTSTPLAGGASFTGTATDVSGYGSIAVNFDVSHVSAVNGISVQFSSDGTNWDHTFALSSGAGTPPPARTWVFPVYAQYYRLVYTNGATGQTHCRIQSILRPYSGLDQAFTGEYIAQKRGPVLMGNTTAGTASPLTVSAVGNVDGLAGTYAGIFTNNYLRAYNGSTWDRLRSDAATGCAATVDFDHHEIHEGDSFHYSYYHAIGAATYKVQFTTPNTTKWIHLTLAMQTIGDTARVRLFENPSTLSGGSGVTPVNRNRNSGTAAGATIILNRTIGTNGTQLCDMLVGGDKIGGAGRGQCEWVLKQNEDYAIVIDGNAAATTYTLSMDWYEHTDI